jgi:hypothetical protein
VDELPPIPPAILTREDYLCDTTGMIWRLPPTLCTKTIDWDVIQTTPRMLRVLMGYVASKLEGRSEIYASSEYFRMTTIRDWNLLTDPWDKHGRIELADVLAVKRHLEDRCGSIGDEYFMVVKRLYAWAADMGVSGFSEEECDDLKRVQRQQPVCFVARTAVAPGAPKSKPTLNRQCYTDAEMTLIAARYLQVERKVRDGETLYRPIGDRDRGRRGKEGKYGVISKNGVLVRPTPVGLPHIVLGWLAWNYGDRPAAFRKLRESHFEFYGAGEVLVGQVRLPESDDTAQITMPESKQRHADYRSTQDPLPLDDNLTRLVPELIAQNRAQRERLGKDNNLDWPLFFVPQEGCAAHFRKRRALPHSDPTQNQLKGSVSLNDMLKLLFEVLQVPDGKGGVIVPTFYSFRDGVVTNMIARGIPLEVIADLHNKTLKALAPYNKPGISFVKTLDGVPEFSETAAAFEIAEPIRERELIPEETLPYFDVDGTLFGKFGRCGCIGASCPVAYNGSMDCYLCPAFRATVEGPHARVYERLWQVRKAMIEVGLPEREYTRYDNHLRAITVTLKRIRLIDEAAQ